MAWPACVTRKLSTVCCRHSFVLHVGPFWLLDRAGDEGVNGLRPETDVEVDAVLALVGDAVHGTVT